MADGAIVTTHDPIGGLAAVLVRIPETGGTPEPLTTLDAESGEVAHVWPRALPGGTAVLFTIFRTPDSGDRQSLDADEARVAVLSLDTGEQRVVVERGYNARYVPTGHLIFARQGALWAVPFDVDRMAITGSEEVVLQGVEVNETFGNIALSVSDDGSLVYVAGSAVGVETPSVVWVDRDGGEELVPLPPPPYSQPVFSSDGFLLPYYSQPRLSPDGTRLAVRVTGDGQQLLWVYDVATGAALRLTNEATVWAPVWSPDSRRILFGWNLGGGAFELYSVPADGSGEPEPLSPDDVSPFGDFPTSLTPDGRTLIFARQFSQNYRDHLEVWELPLDGDGGPRPVIEGAFSRGTAELSPDGDWLVYRSNQSGQHEVYVQPYPGPGPTLPVSIGGGYGPVWSVDGSELYYRWESSVMAVDVTIDGSTIEISTPREVLQGEYFSGGGGTREYHLAPDGRLLMQSPSPPPTDGAAQLTLVLNWLDELQRPVPTN